MVHQNLEVAEYTALQMKQAVVGYGRAAKSQIQAMVQRLLSLPGLPSTDTDAADALGLAITHAHAGAALARLAKAGAVGGVNGDVHKGVTRNYKAGRSR